MIEIKEFVASGIIELYCMNAATEEERKQVEQLAAEHKDVRDEIAAVNESLRMYA